MEHQIAIETVNALYHKKPAGWSEKDKSILNGIMSYLCLHDSCELEGFGEWYDWLKSLPSRINIQPKQEWSDDDEKKLRDVIRLVEQGAPVQSIRDHYTNWLKSLKEIMKGE